MQDLLKVLSGNILAQGIGFLTIIIISRDLGPEQYGIFSLLIAIFMIAIQVSDFGVSTSYVKYVSENLSKAKEDINNNIGNTIKAVDEAIYDMIKKVKAYQYSLQNSWKK